MNEGNGMMKVTLDTSPIYEMIASIIDDRFKIFENRIQSQSVVLTREEAANILKVKPNTISSYVKEKRLMNRGLGKKLLFLKSDIEDLIKNKN